MALPVMSLLPDNKRSVKFRFLRNSAPTMLEKSGVTVYSSSGECSPSIVTSQEPKFNAFFPQQTSFHTRSKLISSFDSIVVGGFLGSKSQIRSVTNPQKICDFICTEVLPDLLGAATECFNKYCDISAVPSPPKKKCAKEVSSADVMIVDTVDFPSVIHEQPSQDKITEGSKQSYAEVAKATSSSGSKVGVKTDGPMSFGKETSKICRKPSTPDHRNIRRKLKRRDRKNNTLPSSGSVNLSSPSSENLPESWKDLRLNQQEKHFGQLKISNNRNCKKLDKLSSTSGVSQQGNHTRDRSLGGHNRHKRQSNHRSHSDTKRGCRSRNIACDIDKFNWRTGEPIYTKMGTEYVDTDFREDLPVERLSSESLSVEQKQDECAEDQRNKESVTFDSTSWTDISNASPRCRRRSIASECSVDSEDSFIIFQSNGALSDSLSDHSDWSDCDSEDSYESDSQASDEADSYDAFSTSYPSLKEVNELWLREYSQDEWVSRDSSEENVLKKEPKRKVCFTNSKPIVHRMLAWDFAYRSSRPGPWEQMARDRERFRTRIRQCEGIISPVLTPAHRNKIWSQLNAH